MRFAYFVGVQIKTGEDPPTNEFENPPFHKTVRGKFSSNMHDDKVNKRLLKLAGQDITPTPQIASRVEEKRGGRNKFEIEKPIDIDSRKRIEKFDDKNRFRVENKYVNRRQFGNRRDFRSRRDRERERERERDRDRNRYNFFLVAIFIFRR